MSVLRAKAMSVLAVAAVTALLAGCAGEGSGEPASPVAAPSPASTSTSPPPSPIEQAVLDAYRSHWSVVNAAYADPGGRDWQPEVTKFTAAPAAILIFDDLYRMREENSVHRGAIKSTAPRVVSVASGTATVTDCIDITDLQVLQNGQPLQFTPDQLRRYRVDSVVAVFDGRWLVKEVTPRRDVPC